MPRERRAVPLAEDSRGITNYQLPNMGKGKCWDLELDPRALPPPPRRTQSRREAPDNLGRKFDTFGFRVDSRKFNPLLTQSLVFGGVDSVFMQNHSSIEAFWL